MSTKRKNIPVEGMPPYPYTDAETRIPPRRNRDERMGWKKPVAAVTTLAALGVGGFMLSRGGGEEPSKTPDRPVATASVDPTPTTEPTFEATPEVKEISPVSVEQYPNAGDAAVALQELLEAYANSATFDRSTQEYTYDNPNYLTTVFGTGEHSPRMQRIIDESYPTWMAWATTNKMNYRQYNTGDDEYYLSLEREGVEVINQDKSGAVVEMTVWASDNANELITKYDLPYDLDSSLDPSMRKHVRGAYTLSIQDGNWVITDLNQTL